MYKDMSNTNFGTLPLNQPCKPEHVKRVVECCLWFDRQHYGKSLPWSIIATVLLNLSASSMKCVVKITVFSPFSGIS